MKFYGQQGEDKILYEVFKNKESGFFIDVGAYDGIRYSNSYIFEQLGWKGICIEPNDHSFSSLEFNRPKSICINALVGEKNSFEMFHHAVGDQGMIYGRSQSAEGESIETPIITLKYLLEILSVTNEIDFLSTDTEGWDLQVLLGFPFNRVKPKIILLESNTDAIEDKLRNEGYLKSKQHYFNTFFCLTQEISDAVNSIDPRMENGENV